MSAVLIWSAASLRSLDAKKKREILRSLTEQDLEFTLSDWRFWARSEQQPPEGRDWTTWLFLGGRGAGKTRAGAEWVKAEIETGGARRIALIGETLRDAREVMVDGPSGLLSLPWPEKAKPVFTSSRNSLTWPCGAVASLFSATKPDSLRGYQFDCAWADEVAKWPKAQETWDMLQFGLRLGKRPRQAVTTTPRPIALLKSLLADSMTVTTRASTYANRDNLAPAFLSRIVSRYEGTRQGRQELLGEMLEDNPGALWQGALIESARVKTAPVLSRIVVAVDPPASAGKMAAACGVIIAGISYAGHAYVLADRTVQGASPTAWARIVAASYHEFEADRVVAEVNQGGDLVAAVLRQVDPGLPITSVHATRGKALRAEPVAALYEQGRVHHVGMLSALEDAMTAFRPEEGALAEGQDRIDALVWALTHLMLAKPRPEPRIRRL